MDFENNPNIAKLIQQFDLSKNQLLEKNAREQILRRTYIWRLTTIGFAIVFFYAYSFYVAFVLSVIFTAGFEKIIAEAKNTDPRDWQMTAINRQFYNQLLIDDFLPDFLKNAFYFLDNVEEINRPKELMNNPEFKNFFGGMWLRQEAYAYLQGSWNGIKIKILIGHSPSTPINTVPNNFYFAIDFPHSIDSYTFLYSASRFNPHASRAEAFDITENLNIHPNKHILFEARTKYFVHAYEIFNILLDRTSRFFQQLPKEHELAVGKQHLIITFNFREYNIIPQGVDPQKSILENSTIHDVQHHVTHLQKFLPLLGTGPFKNPKNRESWKNEGE